MTNAEQREYDELAKLFDKLSKLNRGNAASVLKHMEKMSRLV